MHDKYAMRDTEHKSQKVGLARQIKGQRVIKKEALNFATMFWRLVVRYQLCQTNAKNLLTWDDATLIVSMMDRYDIEFPAIIRHELYERAFSDMTILFFPYLVQLLCDEASVTEVPSVDLVSS